MDKADIRELNQKVLDFLWNEEKSIQCLYRIDSIVFVKLHQTNFKNHYIPKPPISLESRNFDFLIKIIQDKYFEFFTNLGIDQAYRWLNPSLNAGDVSDQNFTRQMILYELGNDVNMTDSQIDECKECFDALYFDTFSIYSWTRFILELIVELQSMED
jgi:hypothetical protein